MYYSNYFNMQLHFIDEHINIWPSQMTFTNHSNYLLYRQTLNLSLFQPWKSVSTLAKSFIGHLLTLEPEHRLTAEEALKHPWLVSMAACSSNKNLHRSISRNLQRRASQASSRCPSSGSTPGSRTSMRSGSRPGSGPQLQRQVTVPEDRCLG